MSSDFDAFKTWNETTTITNTGLSDGRPPIGELNKNGIYLSAITVSSLLIIVSNSFVVMVVVYCRDLHLPTLWNIAFMASCDLLYGLHYMIFTIPSLYLNNFPYSDNMIKTASITMTLLFGQNIFNIFLSIVERYIAVCWPLRYLCLMSRKRFLMAVFTLFAINIIRLCLIIFPNSVMYYNRNLGICLVNFNTMLSTIASVGLPFLTTTMITILLVKIGMEFRCRQMVYASSTLKNRFTATMCFAASVFIFSYLPTCGSIVMEVVKGADNLNIVYLQVSTVILLSNSFWNVVIYATTYRPFRRGFSRLFFKKVTRDRARREDHSQIL